MAMYVIEVIPLTVLPPNVPQVLSYYHESELEKGAVVEVLVNNRKTAAIVIGASILESRKIFLKKSGFELKKISGVLSERPQVSDFQFKIALWLANQYIAPLGLSLKTVLPSFFGKKRYQTPAVTVREKTPAQKPQWVICRAKDSYANIAQAIMKAGDGQMLIIVPEMSVLPYLYNNIAGAEMVSSQTTNKDLYRIWHGISNSSIKIVIGTRQALFLPFTDLRHLIVVDPLHEFYKSDLSPKYRTPELAEMVAQFYGAHYTAISNILGVQAFDRAGNGRIDVRDLISPHAVTVDVVDMVAEMKQHYVGVFSSVLKERIIEAVRNGKKILIVSARRGYSGFLLCERCGFSFKCPNCDIPMRIHRSVDLVLLCHRCNTTLPYPSFCPNCHSSSIKSTGPAGSQKLFEEIQRMIEYGQIPNVPTVILDTDVTQNETEEQEILDTVKNKSPVILIATQKIFSHVYDHSFDLIVIPQLDALASGSDFSAGEYLWYQLEKLMDLDPEIISVQTLSNNNTVPAVIGHRYEPLYRGELEARSLFRYPPFSRIVKLTFTHRMPNKAVAESRTLVEKLKRAAVHFQYEDRIIVSETSRAFIQKEKGVYTATVLVKVLPGVASLRELLRFVPSSWLIDVDPRNTV